MITVFTNGAYDCLHYGHFKLLEYAKSLGNHVIVAIDGDDRVKEKKGMGRPIHTAKQRVFNLLSTVYVDYVYVFSSDSELENLIKDIAPDYMVIGSDWHGKIVIGGEHAKELVFFPRIEEFSSTKIIENAAGSNNV